MAASNKKQDFVHLSIPSQFTPSHPWLVMCNGVEKETQIFFDLSKGLSYVRNIPELSNKKILSNCMEWLVLIDYATMECSLFNIFSMKKIELPKYNTIFCECNLTSPPEDPNCRVVFLDAMHLNISICRPGDAQFVNTTVNFPEKHDFFACGTTCFDGNIYTIAYPSLSLIRASLNDPTLEFQTVISGESIQKELLDVSSDYYLTESCGEFLMVTKSDLHENSCIFHVFQAELSSSKWLLLKNIGDRTIFLESLSLEGISCSSSESGIRRNCIYYTVDTDKTLYIFDLEDQSFTMTIPCPIINPINLTPHWVMVPRTNESCDPFLSLLDKTTSLLH